MSRLTLFLTGCVLVAGLWMYLAVFQPVQAQVQLRPDDQELVAQGADIYAVQCAACHGADLQGQPDWQIRGDDGLLPAPPHDGTGHTWHHDDQTLFTLTKYGLAGLMDNSPASGMPSYDGVLSDAEIIATLSFIKSEWPEDIRAFHDSLNAR